MEKRILTRKQAAVYCGISTTTIYRLVSRGDFAPKLQLSDKRIGFFEHDLDAWLNSRKQTTKKITHE